eukprot:GHVS01038239.1.p1 GENE.GHVS01038239.1~~GHVS01038239.1.p1  ORF type:complete len:807 (+),score=197.00 GHVS01038239.1:138-2423(+)
MADLACLLTSFEAAHMQLVSSSQQQETDLVGRQEQQQQLQETLDKFHSDPNGAHGGLFVAGPAGTGKTLTVQTFLRSYQTQPERQHVGLMEINAQQLPRAQTSLAAVARRLLVERRQLLLLRAEGGRGRTAVEEYEKEVAGVCRLAPRGEAASVEFQQQFRQLWNSLPKRNKAATAAGSGRRRKGDEEAIRNVVPLQLVFIDEIDCLCSSREGPLRLEKGGAVGLREGEEVAAQLYRLALQPNSNMILIGCSNYTQLGAYLTSVLTHRSSSSTRSSPIKSSASFLPSPSPTTASAALFATLTFRAYSATDLQAILSSKLAGCGSRVDCTALVHIAQDVHGTSGDCREAVSKLGKTLSRRIGDIRALLESSSSPTSDAPPHLTPTLPPTLTPTAAASATTSSASQLLAAPPYLTLEDVNICAHREEESKKNEEVPKTTTTAAPPSPAGLEEDEDVDEDDTVIVYVRRDESNLTSTPLPSPKKQICTPLRRSPRLSPSSFCSPTTTVGTPSNHTTTTTVRTPSKHNEWRPPCSLFAETPQRRNYCPKRKLEEEEEEENEENMGSNNVKEINKCPLIISPLISKALLSVGVSATTGSSSSGRAVSSVLGKLEEVLGQLTPTDLMILHCLCTLNKRKNSTTTPSTTTSSFSSAARPAKKFKGMVNVRGVKSSGLRRAGNNGEHGSPIRVMELQDELKRLFRQLDPAGVLYPTSTKSIQDAALAALGSHEIVKVEPKSEEIFLIRSAEDLFQTKFMQNISTKLYPR